MAWPPLPPPLLSPHGVIIAASAPSIPPSLPPSPPSPLPPSLPLICPSVHPSIHSPPPPPPPSLSSFLPPSLPYHKLTTATCQNGRECRDPSLPQALHTYHTQNTLDGTCGRFQQSAERNFHDIGELIPPSPPSLPPSSLPPSLPPSLPSSLPPSLPPSERVIGTEVNT